MVTNTGEVSYSSSSDEDYGVLLKVMSDTGDVGGRLHSVRKTNSRDLTKSRVRLLRGGGGYLRTYSTLLRCRLVGGDILDGIDTVLQYRSLGLVLYLFSSLSDKLVKGWHFSLLSFVFRFAPQPEFRD